MQICIISLIQIYSSFFEGTSQFLIILYRQAAHCLDTETLTPPEVTQRAVSFRDGNSNWNVEVRQVHHNSPSFLCLVAGRHPSQEGPRESLGEDNEKSWQTEIIISIKGLWHNCPDPLHIQPTTHTKTKQAHLPSLKVLLVFGFRNSLKMIMKRMVSPTRSHGYFPRLCLLNYRPSAQPRPTQPFFVLVSHWIYRKIIDSLSSNTTQVYYTHTHHWRLSFGNLYFGKVGWRYQFENIWK